MSHANIKGFSSIAAIFAAVCCVSALTSCSIIAPSNSATTSNPSSTSSSSSNQKQAAIDFSALTDPALVSLAIAGLNSECSALSGPAASAANWALESRTADEAELRFQGEAGTMGIQAISDSVGGVFLLISPAYVEATNPFMWNAGCTALASDPSQQ